MGKIKTEGRVTLEFEPDLYEISITVQAEGKTSGATVTVGKQQTEQLLQAFQDELGIQPEQISAERETVDRPTRYDNKDPNYHFSRRLCLKIPADNRLREAVTDLLAELNDVTYTVTEQLSSKSKQKQMALDAAVKCSKEKAEQLASALNCKIVGFEEILTDKTGDIKLEEMERGIVPLASYKRNASKLKKPKIQISGEVIVVWLTEPIE